MSSGSAEYGEPFETVNEHGTPVTAMTCGVCGKPFTVCPAVPLSDVARLWGNNTPCLTPGCPSYDITRDADIFFEAASEAGWIKREEVDCA